MKLKEAIEKAEFVKEWFSPSGNGGADVTKEFGLEITQALDALIAHAKQPAQVTDEMVEAGAIGIFKRSLFPSYQGNRNWDNCSDDAKQFYRDESKAALQAALGVK